MLQYFQKQAIAHGDPKAPEKGALEPSSQGDHTAKSRFDFANTALHSNPTSSVVEHQSLANVLDPESNRPVISDEDEIFLLRIASEGEAAPSKSLVESVDIDNNAKVGRQLRCDAGETEGAKESTQPDGEHSSPSSNKKTWVTQWMEWGKPQPDRALQGLLQIAQATHEASIRRGKSKDQADTAETLRLAADEVKKRSNGPIGIEEETMEEQKQVGNILQKLDLSSINNRVVGVSKDTQKLLESFKQVLKDIVNGVPTAYEDLEKLLTDRQSQLERLFGSLPSYLQTLIKTVPVKIWATMAPQVAAAMSAEQTNSEKPETNDSEPAKKKKRRYIPSLKNLIGKKGAVAGMLRSIITFLEARFPAALAGTNVIVSLAVFILLFVFWYCHKRGRETRLAKEQETLNSLSEAESASDLEKASSSQAGLSDVESNQLLRSTGVSREPYGDEVEGKIDILAEQLSRPSH